MLRRFVSGLLFAVRWVAAAIFATLFTGLLLSWLVGSSCRDVIDSREFWVAWVHEAHLATQLRGGVRGVLSSAEGRPTLAGLTTSEERAALDEALAEAESQLGDDLDMQLGDHLDDVVAFLTARTNRLPFELGLKSALAGTAKKASTRLVNRLCPSGEGRAITCDTLATKAASAAASGLASWIASSSVAERLTQAILGAVMGLHQVRSAALAVRATIHLVGLAALVCLLSLALIAWRLRTIATLVGTSLLVVSAALTPFVGLFDWGIEKVLGPLVGELASSAAGLRPYGVGLHLQLALGGLGLLVLRLVLPKWRAQFWARCSTYGDPPQRAAAMAIGGTPAGLLEPAHVVRLMLRKKADRI